MENLIINLLVSAVFALLFTIYIIVVVYKDKLKKMQKQCDEFERQNIMLRKRNLSLCDDLSELCEKYNKEKVKMQAAQGIIESYKKKNASQRNI